MSFGIYFAGFIIMIVGLAYGAYLLHVPPHWIGTGIVVMVGLGILSGVAKTRQRDSSS
jgi:putative Mn2+ efflux pump MntP